MRLAGTEKTGDPNTHDVARSARSAPKGIAHMVKVSTMRFSSSSILSVTTYSRISVRERGSIEDFTTPFDLDADVALDDFSNLGHVRPGSRRQNQSSAPE